ncbi:hypothetical protein [Pengzhenrongella sp.]|jgi:hypothetical protein|uniref:hypothetical protein n=1 Tax=Pengzhenrongella sp. TaxID=2888820 RepID=UPI002F952605
MAARHEDHSESPDEGDRRSDAEVAEAWAEIVARLGELDVTADPDDVGPAATNPRPAPEQPVVPAVAGPPVDREPPHELTGRNWEGTDQIDAAEAEIDDREHFVPPDPGPIFGGDPLLTMAWIGAAGIPIALLILVIVWRGAPNVVLQGAGIIFVLCTVLLIWRLPHHRDESDDDPGAVV